MNLEIISPPHDKTILRDIEKALQASRESQTPERPVAISFSPFALQRLLTLAERGRKARP